jgi:hypothetical protein
VEDALQRGYITPAEGGRLVRFYEQNLKSSTYLTSRRNEEEALSDSSRDGRTIRMPMVRLD